MMKNHLSTTVAFILLTAGSSIAAPSRFTLASQFDWVANRGFYVNFENDTAPAGISKLSTLKLIAGVADGKGWHYMTATPSWSYGHTYNVVLKVDPRKTTYTLDGAKIDDVAAAFTPDDAPVTANSIPDWANAPTEYRVVQTQIEIDDTSGRHTAPIPPADGAASLFGSGSAVTLTSWRYNGKPFTVHMAFRLEKPLDPAQYFPLVDRYGQPTFARYPGKVQSDADLKAEIPAEKRHVAGWSAASPYNKYGGQLHPKWHDIATGYYHIARHNGFQWLIDPTGAPLFYTGVCTANIPSGDATPVAGREAIFAWLPAKNSEFGSVLRENIWGGEPGITYVGFDDANLIRKYGANWKTRATDAEKARIRAWGFSGMGKWTADWSDVPRIPVLALGSVPNLVRHPDFFDPEVVSKVRASLTDQIKPRLKDSNVVGWSFGNEFDEVVTTDEIREILKKPAGTPSRDALLNYAVREIYGGDLSKATTLSTGADADIEKLRQFYADRFYGFIHDTIKGIDPNHLFLGWWLVPYWWQNESDWKLQGAHVDVMGIDYYNHSFTDPTLLRWIRESGKPVIVGEYSFPPSYNGTRGFGNFQSTVPTPADAGTAYSQWIAQTATNPNVVGVCWFEMRDEPITGRGPGHGPDVVYGEHYAFGLVDVTDAPKWDLVDAVHAANVQASACREKASDHRK
jgi:hypothetical protein